MTDYQPRIPVKVRTARKRHACDHHRCGSWIEPGDKYELHAAPPWSDGNESPRWVTFRVHIGGGYRGNGCDEAAAYREKRERERANG